MKDRIPYSPVDLQLDEIMKYKTAKNYESKHNEYEKLKQHYKANHYDMNPKELEALNTECNYLLAHPNDSIRRNQFRISLQYYKIRDKEIIATIDKILSPTLHREPLFIDRITGPLIESSVAQISS